MINVYLLKALSNIYDEDFGENFCHGRIIKEDQKLINLSESIRAFGKNADALRKIKLTVVVVKHPIIQNTSRNSLAEFDFHDLRIL